jgi:hypothetical protein
LWLHASRYGLWPSWPLLTRPSILGLQ